MISYQDALALVLASSKSLGTETVHLTDAGGRYLAETIHADRHFPPFDRVTMDGIAIQYSSWKSNQTVFKIESIAQAGAPEMKLADSSNCIEVTTGAMLPQGCDTVIPYEHLTVCNSGFRVGNPPKKGQNIHSKGSDSGIQSVLLEAGSLLSAPEIAILATVGKNNVLVKKAPKVTIISTGDELVPVEAIPEPHQIRMSNNLMLNEALLKWGIKPTLVHIADDQKALIQKLSEALSLSEVIIISGGVSMGKFDFLPEILEQLEVKKIFHKVAQKPGKPFWFGSWKKGNCTVFSLPGNPVSSFLNYLVYFRVWLMKGWDLPLKQYEIRTTSFHSNPTDLTQFQPVQLTLKEGQFFANPILNNGSGDILSLTLSDGFIRLDPQTKYPPNSILPFIPSRNWNL